MKKIFCFYFSLIAVLFVWGQNAEKIDGCGLNNLYRIDSTFYRSEQPNKEEFQLLYNYGIREILNLRSFHSDEDLIEGLDMTLHEIPMRAGKINDQKVIDALKVIKDRKGTMLVHCKHGSDRTGLMVALYRVIFQNWTKEDAITEMTGDKFGFHSIYTNIVKYVRNIDVAKIRQQLNITK
ncbi:MAG: tyrosine-protein phosphatase [Bacteroidales bacterium]|jgi:protein tyrosine/serine phosphatase|nr:tyrosine-protein phosphatase [Bacteroidales bacterium]